MRQSHLAALAMQMINDPKKTSFLMWDHHKLLTMYKLVNSRIAPISPWPMSRCARDDDITVFEW